MRHPFAALVVVPLLFCSPQTTTVPVSVGSALPVVVTTMDAAPASAAPPNALQQQRIDAANEVLRQVTGRYSAGAATIDEVGMWSERLFLAQKEALSAPAMSDAATARVSQMKKVEALASQKASSGAAPTADVTKATYFRLSAEIDLAKL